ncbi:hypothetical protein SAMN02910298_02190 [Pseudobutyrivibrio sp. YE44]|uniref:hypothetical protein n=1 Tax=Pseudobutyrivibrio sp. YE44 TaxID=1520802 RepID=UPI00088E76F3|nr:hypothetical protein [Pseudobutyrivibrio sp. YE44]SDB43748.1 hypothetical protein SAMN02910298_02190 [Pseudobutyrivibrio sp. YE44]
MGHNFKYDEALIYAIEHDELNQIMNGLGKYEYEDKNIGGPVQHIALMASIYKYALENNSIKGLFIEELENLSKSDIDEKLLCLQYLLDHLYLKNKNENTFDFEIDEIYDEVTAALNIARDNKILSEENERFLEFYCKRIEYLKRGTVRKRRLFDKPKKRDTRNRIGPQKNK